MFLYRRGDGTFCDIDRLWRQIHSDQAIRRMKTLGMNLSGIHFHKGYGLEHEAASIREAAEWAERLHKHGIKVGAYIGCTFFPETFKHPDRQRMLMKHDVSGWASQYFREFWCCNSPYAIDYFKEVVRVAIEEVQADVLHFDQPFSFYHDQLCHCEYCLAAFHRFIARDIPEILAAAGYQRPEELLPPPCGRRDYLTGVSELEDPGDIAWTLFHAKAGYRALEKFVDYARTLRPDIGVLYNGANLCGITSFSRPDMEIEKIHLVDMAAVEDENENPVYVMDDGMPVSRFRAYKAGSRAQTRMCYYTVTENAHNRLKLAEAAAFNYHSLGFVELAMQQNHRLHDEADIQFLQYLVQNEDLFLDRQPWHNVAVLRHHESQLLNPFPCALSPYVVEQMLFEHHVCFTLIGADELDRRRLSREFDLLVLPDSKCLSNEQIAQLEEFVSGGGNLLAVGNTATATPLNQYRGVWGLSKIFGRDDCPVQRQIAYDEIAESKTQVTQKDKPTEGSMAASFGKGRAIYLPGLDFTLPDKTKLNLFGGYDWYYHPYWKPPANSEEFMAAVTGLLEAAWRVRGNLPRHVGMESYTIENGYRFYLVNYLASTEVAKKHIRLNIEGLRPNNVEIVWQSPERNCPLEATSDNDGGLTIDLPTFSVLGTLSVYHR